MQRTIHTGALGAFLALLLVGGPSAALATQDAGGSSGQTAEKAQADEAKQKEAEAKGAKGDEEAAKPAAKQAGEKAEAGAKERKVPAAGRQRLRPGLSRLETGIDLSKVQTGAGVNVQAEEGEDAAAPAGNDPLERQGPRAGLEAARAGQDAQPRTSAAAQPALTPFGQDPAQDDTSQLPPGHATLLGEERHDFGQLIQGAHASHVFRLVSDGENELVISRIKPSCGCTVANVSLVGSDGTRSPYATGAGIPPGTEVEIEAAFKSDGKQGHTKTQVALYCNDPRSVISLMLEAEVLPVLVLEPRTINLGVTTSAQPVEGTMRLSSPTLPAYKVEVDPQFLQPQVKVELTPIDPDPEGRAKEWDVKIVLGPELPEGMRNYPVRLTTDQLIPSPRDEHEHAPTNYFVIGYAQVQVEGLVSANPAYVPFGMVRPGQVVERVVRIDCRDDFKLSPDVPVQMTALIQSQVFDYEKAFTTRVEEVEGQNALDLTVRLEGLPEEASGSFGGMLKLEVGHPDKKELLVRFSGVCRPGLPDPSQKRE